MIPWWFFAVVLHIQFRRDFCLQVTGLFSLSLQEGANTRVSKLLLCPGWQVSWNNLLPALMLPEHRGRAAMPSTKIFLRFEGWVRPWTPNTNWARVHLPDSCWVFCLYYLLIWGVYLINSVWPAILQSLWIVCLTSLMLAINFHSDGSGSRLISACVTNLCMIWLAWGATAEASAAPGKWRDVFR